MNKTTTAPKAGDRFKILCSNTSGATTVAVVTAEQVTRLNDGRYRISTTRPGGADIATARMEFTVDATGHDRNDYVEPVR